MDLQFPEIPARFGVDPKSNSAPVWDSKYDHAVRNWCNAAYEEADFDRKNCEELKQLGTYIDYIEGRQWKGPRPSYKSKPVNPKTRENFEELVGLLTDIKPIMDVKSDNPDAAFQDAAKIINKAIRAWAFRTRYSGRLALNVSWGILTSSFCKWQWNPELSYGVGDLEAVVMSPKDVMLLKSHAVDPIQSAACVIADRPVSLGWLKRKYPTRGYLVTPDERYSSYTMPTQAPPQVPSMLWDIMNDGIRRKLGGEPEVRNSAFPMALHREFWFRDYSTNTSNVDVQMGAHSWKYIVKPGQLLYPRGRVVTMAGRYVMDDNPSPYFHGKYPFSMLRLNVVPWSLYGLSDVKSWIGLQDILNQILAGVLDMIKRAVNPGFFAPRNAFTEAVWNSLDFSKPGERAAYSPIATHEPKFAPAPVLPGYVMQAYERIERALDGMGGKSASNQMLNKKQLPGSDSIESIQFMRTTAVRQKGRNIEGFIEEGGNLMVPNMVQFYTAKRRMSMMGRDGTAAADFDWNPQTMIPAGMPPEEFIRSFNHHVKPGSLLQTEKRGKIQDAIMLRRGGDLDRETLFEIIDEEGLDVKKIEAGLKREMQEKIAMLPQKGKAAKAK